MKQYKAVTAPTVKKAEQAMNNMALDGWRVVAITELGNITVELLMVFEKEGDGPLQ